MSDYFNVLATLRLLYFAAFFNTGRESGERVRAANAIENGELFYCPRMASI